jgi:hypothetical protein
MSDEEELSTVLRGWVVWDRRDGRTCTWCGARPCWALRDQAGSLYALACDTHGP